MRRVISFLFGNSTYDTPFSFCFGILFSSQNFHFYKSALRQFLYSYSRTSRIWLAEKLCIYLVHSSKIIHTVQIYSGLYYMREVCTCSLQDVLGIGKTLTSLLLDATLYKVACCWVDRNLTLCKNKTIYFDSLAIWTNSSRRIVCVNCVHNYIFY